MTVRPDTYCAFCVQMAVLRIFRHTEQAVAERISTGNRPTGVSVRFLYKHLKDNPDHRVDYQRFFDWATLSKREKGISVLDVTAKNLQAKMEEQLGDAWSQIVSAIQDGNLDAAWRVIEYVQGKPRANVDHKITGQIGHAHIVAFDPLPVRQLAAQELDMINSSRLLKQLPAGVIADANETIDADVIE